VLLSFDLVYLVIPATQLVNPIGTDRSWRWPWTRVWLD